MGTLEGKEDHWEDHAGGEDKDNEYLAAGIHPRHVEASESGYEKANSNDAEKDLLRPMRFLKCQLRSLAGTLSGSGITCLPLGACPRLTLI